MWTDKEGKKLTAKEFAKRFKEGLELVTPVQRLKNEVRANFIMFVGYLVGLIALILYMDNFSKVKLFTYALMIIFFGAAWSTGIKWFALRQQLKQLENFDAQSFDLNEVFGNLEVERK